MISGRNFCNDILDCDIPIGQYWTTFNYLTNVHIYIGKVYTKKSYVISLMTSTHRYRTGFSLHKLCLRRNVVKQLITLHFSRWQNKLIA